MPSVFTPLPEAAPGAPVGDWHPTRYTPTLTGTEDFTTDGDRLLTFAGRHWTIPGLARLALDAWQTWLVRHVLERYPDDWPVEHLRGQLRYRRVVISMGRQNGKSVLGALFVIYFLILHARAPRVIGLASIDRQAKIVYERVKYGIDNSPAISREIKTTETRGITRRTGAGVYQTLPAVEDSAQGEPATGVVYDELHLGLSALWDAMLLAMRAQRHGLMIGLTTAGDDNSLLLLRLYREGDAAIEAAAAGAPFDERIGFFCWEAPSDDLTPENIIAANPAVACGRIPLDQVYADAADMDADTDRGPDGLTGRQRRIRYTNNRFIEGAADSWANTHAWTRSAVPREDLAHGPDVVYSLDRTEDWAWAAVVATTRASETYTTELVASIAHPTPETLVTVCTALARDNAAATFAMPADSLKDVADRLKEEGLTVWKLHERELSLATTHARAAIARGTVAHPGDPLLSLQMPRTRSRAVEAGARISRGLSLGDCDATIALAAGLYVAALTEPTSIPIW